MPLLWMFHVITLSFVPTASKMVTVAFDLAPTLYVSDSTSWMMTDSLPSFSASL
jgi:hypothetical protein